MLRTDNPGGVQMSACKDKQTVTKIRKHNRINAFDDNRKLLRYAQLASRNAIGESFEAGISVVYMKDGELVRENPDHEVTVVKKLQNKEKFDLREYLCHG